MQVKHSELSGFLAEGLRSVYVLCGSEPVLLNEAAEMIYDAAKRDGIEERETHRFDEQGTRLKNNPPWNDVLDDLSESSLFGSRKLVEARVGVASLSKPTLANLQKFAESDSTNVLLIQLVDPLTAQRKRAEWYSTLRNDEYCALLVADALKPDQIIKWAQAKAKSMGLNLQPDASRKLAYLCEGNLLAVQQALEVIQLTHEAGATISARAIDDADASNAEVRQVVQAACSGNVAGVAKLLDLLDNQRTSSSSYGLFVLNSLSNILTLAHAQSVGQRSQPPRYLQQQVGQLTHRHDRGSLESLLIECSRLNSTMLGMARGEETLLIRALLCNVAGRKKTALDSEYAWREIDRRVAN